jgi:hypothetical protein
VDRARAETIQEALRRVDAASTAMRAWDPAPYIACWSETPDAAVFGAWGPHREGLAGVPEAHLACEYRFASEDHLACDDHLPWEEEASSAWHHARAWLVCRRLLWRQTTRRVHGQPVGAPPPGRAVDSKAELVDRLRAEKYLGLAEDYGFTICQGRAEFVDQETIACDGEEIRAGNYIIATGASPAIPSIPGLQDAGYLTNTTALELREPPRRLVVLGAGPVGLELGQLFLHLGSKVTFISRGRVAPREEPASETLRSVLEEEGAQVVTAVQVTEVLRTGADRIVVYSA